MHDINDYIISKVIEPNKFIVSVCLIGVLVCYI